MALSKRGEGVDRWGPERGPFFSQVYRWIVGTLGFLAFGLLAGTVAGAIFDLTSQNLPLVVGILPTWIA